MKSKSFLSSVLVSFSIILWTCQWAFAGGVVAWGRQIGTSNHDPSYGIALDALGYVYISGPTTGSLGDNNKGSNDIYLSKFDDAGNLIWIQQIGTAKDDISWDLASDRQGHIYIGGWTHGSLEGFNSGFADAILCKYSTTGNLLWARQLGTTHGDYVHSVTTDVEGNIYIGGWTLGLLGEMRFGSYDAFVGKYDLAGNLIWIQQFGTSKYDYCRGVTIDISGDVYVTGYTSGSFKGSSNGGDDVFLMKMDSSGNVLWKEQFGSSDDDRGWDITTDLFENVYITGYTKGSLGEATFGGEDIFISKYDIDGNFLWTQQIGTSNVDTSYNILTDEEGNIFISGQTSGLLGEQQFGWRDVFVSKLNLDGDLIWTQQLGTEGRDISRGMTIDNLSHLYITGDTNGSFCGPNVGDYDAFVIKFDVSEPPTLPIRVLVDIKPRSCPNPVNVKSKGVLPIAILGTVDYDVTTIDPTSVRLAGVEPLRSGYEDVATPVDDTNDCNCIEAGPDGFLDLTLKFGTQRIVESVGDVNDGDVLELLLSGVLSDETPIEGADCILIRGRHKPINTADINKDGVVNAADFAILAQNWLQSSIVDE